MEAKELRIGNYLEYFIETDNLGWQPTKIDWQDLKRLSEQPELEKSFMKVKLINGKWKAVFINDSEDYNNLNEHQKKLFSVLLNCELIIAKHEQNSGNRKLTLFEKLLNITKETYHGFVELFKLKEPFFEDEYDYEIYEFNYWKNK